MATPLTRRLQAHALAWKAWWRLQHAWHVSLSVLIAIGGVLTFSATIWGVWVYIAESEDRSESATLRRIEIINNAWARVQASQGSPGDIGQIFAIQTLLRDRSALSAGDLSKVNVTGADFRGANLTNTIFADAVIENANFDGATISGHTLRGAKIRSVDLTRTLVDDSDATLDLTNAHLFSVKFPSHTFERITLAGLFAEDFSIPGLLDSVVLATSSCIAGLQMAQRPAPTSGYFAKTLDFSGAKLFGADFRSADLTYAEFRGAEFYPGIRRDGKIQMFRRDQLHDGQCPTRSGAYLDVSRDDSPALQKVLGFSMQDIVETDFTGANLTGANLRGSNLSAATGLTQRQIDTACLDAETKVPPSLAWNGKPCTPRTANER
jgi:uncharacterized protein YjbI with pentapeptide repeats